MRRKLWELCSELGRAEKRCGMRNVEMDGDGCSTGTRMGSVMGGVVRAGLEKMSAR